MASSMYCELNVFELLLPSIMLEVVAVVTVVVDVVELGFELIELKLCVDADGGIELKPPLDSDKLDTIKKDEYKSHIATIIG
jgi:hypothetical protein